MSVFRDDILRGRVALVTGGATGLGKEITRALGQHGARLCIASRKQENLEAACHELQSDGLDCMWVTCDIREPERVEHVVSEILKRHGRLDIVVNNAAGNFPAPISGISYNGFKAVVDIEFRNTGLIGGTWCGSRHDEDQLWTNRPIPELARYRSPIEGLYHAHQTSGHPGGLCLMAIPYNLMHILIEDGVAEPGDWWYASPYYIAQEGKISARRPSQDRAPVES